MGNGDPCFKAVVWAYKTGLREHPDWYQGLTKASSFQDIQTRLSEQNQKGCVRACPGNTAVAPLAWHHPGLFCFSVMRPGYEEEILRLQIQRGVGIFACDEQAVLSDAG